MMLRIFLISWSLTGLTIAEIKDDHLIAYWPLDGSVVDPIGRHHGRPRHYPSPIAARFAPSKFGQGLEVNGQGEFVEITESPVGRFDIEPMGLSCWVRVTGKSGKILATGNFSWSLSYQTPGFFLGHGHRAPVHQAFAADNETTAAQWFHIVMNIREARGSRHFIGEFYLNGELLSSGAPMDTSGQYRLSFGASRGAPWDGFAGSLDEVAIWSAPLDVDDVGAIWNGGEGRTIRELLEDDDEDGLPDKWEEFYFADTRRQTASSDPDGDFLSNALEFIKGTVPYWEDTDSDGWNDNIETSTGNWIDEDSPGTNPVLADTDGDGVGDRWEAIGPVASDPTRFDTDGDGFADGDEVIRNTIPSDPESKPDLNVGLRGYWTFDEDLHDDVSDYEGHLTGHGGFQDVPALSSRGLFAKALHLDGTQFVDIDTGEDAAPFGFVGSPFSVSAWVLLEDWSNRPTNVLISHGKKRRWHVAAELSASQPRKHGWSFYVPRGEFINTEKFHIVDLAPLNTIREFEVTDRRWHHLVVVYLRLTEGGFYGGPEWPPLVYVDGVLLDQARVKTANLKSLFIPQAFQGIDETHGLQIGGFAENPDTLGWIGLIDDLAIWGHRLTSSDVQAIYRAGNQGSPLSTLLAVDTDGDGMGDDWEERYGLDPDEASDAGEDPDGDTLTNAQEYHLQTNPQEADTDHDGYADAVETGTRVWINATDTGTSPTLEDTDQDGLLDGEENPDLEFAPGLPVSISDPNQFDTDGDGLHDPVEYTFDSNPSSAASLPSLDAGLVSYWPFDESLADVHGPFHLHPEGAEPITLEGGRFGNALALNGIDQYVESVSTTRFSFPGKSFTVALWMLRHEHPMTCAIEPERCVYDLGILTNGRSWALRHGRGRVGFRPASAFPEAHDTLDRWDHLAVVVDVDANTTTIYSNGMVSSDGSYVAPHFTTLSDSPLRIGALSTSPSQSFPALFFAGLIDEVAIWERSLALSEIQSLAGSERSLEERIASAPEGLRILAIERTASAIALSWSSRIGETYAVEYAETLEPAARWRRVLGPIEANADSVTIMDDNGPRRQRSTGYYRVRELSD